MRREDEKSLQRKVEKKARQEEKQRKYQSFLKEVSGTVKEIITGRQKTSEENEYVKQFFAEEKGEDKRQSKYSYKEKASFGTLIAITLHSILLIVRYCIAIANMEKIVFCNSLFYIIPVMTIPYVIWVIATNENFWAFHKRKRLFFYMCTINAALTILQPLYTLIRDVTSSLVLKVPTNPCLTEEMIVLLAKLLCLGAFAVFLFVIYRQLEPIILSETTKRQIELFKLQHIKDSRESRQYKYDIISIKSLETGRPITIKENDRFLQSDLIGSSGTGKTTTINLGVICQDTEQKLINREKRQEEYMQMILQKKATIKGPLKEFDENAVIPLGKNNSEYAKNEKRLANIRKKYSDCGMTIVAPNPDLMTDIIKLCAARKISVNVLDPVYSYKEYKNVKELSINPFYVSFGLEESERVLWISKAATVFSDVLIATNQMGGQSDVYFTDISLSVSSNIAAIVMLAKNIQGQQAFIDDVHECISNFDNLTPYIEIIEQYFDISVDVQQENNNRGGKITADSFMNSAMQNDGGKRDKKARKNPYYQQILFVKQELLGPGREAMFSQARGLRNLINKILQDPRIKTKLSATDENRIDFDRILSNNEITVVNTAIELGQSTSTSFGLFFLLLHRTSVLRRPKSTRTPHFLWIDECAQYVHPFFDEVVALYRQYRVAAVLSLQTLTQLEKHSATAYLKSVFLGAGTHIVFGRMATEEMKIFSEMAGISRENQVQKTQTSNSVLASNPSSSESVRTTPTTTNILEGADMRILDFLELTVFTVDSGRVLPGQLARVFFVGPEAFETRQTKTFLWEKAVPEAFREPIIDTEADTDEEESEEPAIEFDDTVLSEAEQELIIQSTPAEDRLPEGEEKESLSLNDLYSMLLSDEK